MRTLLLVLFISGLFPSLHIRADSASAFIAVTSDSVAGAEDLELAPAEEAEFYDSPDSVVTYSSSGDLEKKSNNSIDSEEELHEVQGLVDGPVEEYPSVNKGDTGNRAPASNSNYIVSRLLVLKKIFASMLAVLKRNALKILFLIVSIGVITLTVVYINSSGEKKRFLTTTRLSIMDKEVQKTCRYIEKNFADPQLSLSTICTDLVTGEAFLEALFENELGMSVAGFIDQVRVNRCKIILSKEPQLSSLELFGMLGFPSQKQFESTFLSIAGVSVETFKSNLPKT